MRARLAAAAAIAAIATVTAAQAAPVHQLPPGHVTLATVPTPQGPIALTLHRIRYEGKVRLCDDYSTAGSQGGSCATYPIGLQSGQNIGTAPVWWGTAFIGLCTRQRFQVIGGVVLRAGLTAWLHTPSGVSRMPVAAIPKAFGVAGGYLYALVDAAPTSVTLTDAAGRTVYTGTVDSVAHLPTPDCKRGVFSVMVSGKGSGTIP